MDSPNRNKARYWTGVLYNENMRPDWQEVIDEVLQVPFAYCVHDKDIVEGSEEGRKVHTHIILAFGNTTTYKNVLSIFDLLSGEGRKAINTCESVINIKYAYDYLIHDTEKCRKKGKFLYPDCERIKGNNFDIGSYVQLSMQDKNELLKYVIQVVRDNCIENFADFYDCIESDLTSDLFEVIKSNSGFIERFCKGNYLRNHNKGC